MRRFLSNIQKTFQLSEEELDEIRSGMKVVELRKNELFLEEGQICRTIGFLEYGSMRLFYESKNKEVCNNFFFENAVVGSLASFLTQTPSLVNIAAIEKCELLTFSYQQVMDLISDYPTLKAFGFFIIQEQLLLAEKREAELLKYAPEDRFRRLLEIHPKIFNRVPLYYVASYLNITPETLSRYRKKFMI